jgi:hypothetical protein
MAMIGHTGCLHTSNTVAEMTATATTWCHQQRLGLAPEWKSMPRDSLADCATEELIALRQLG